MCERGIVKLALLLLHGVCLLSNYAHAHMHTHTHPAPSSASFYALYILYPRCPQVETMEKEEVAVERKAKEAKLWKEIKAMEGGAPASGSGSGSGSGSSSGAAAAARFKRVTAAAAGAKVVRALAAAPRFKAVGKKQGGKQAERGAADRSFTERLDRLYDMDDSLER